MQTAEQHFERKQEKPSWERKSTKYSKFSTPYFKSTNFCLIWQYLS